MEGLYPRGSAAVSQVWLKSVPLSRPSTGQAPAAQSMNDTCLGWGPGCCRMNSGPSGWLDPAGQGIGAYPTPAEAASRNAVMSSA